MYRNWSGERHRPPPSVYFAYIVFSEKAGMLKLPGNHQYLGVGVLARNCGHEISGDWLSLIIKPVLYGLLTYLLVKKHQGHVRKLLCWKLDSITKFMGSVAESAQMPVTVYAESGVISQFCTLSFCQNGFQQSKFNICMSKLAVECTEIDLESVIGHHLLFILPTLSSQKRLGCSNCQEIASI